MTPPRYIEGIDYRIDGRQPHYRGGSFLSVTDLVTGSTVTVDDQHGETIAQVIEARRRERRARLILKTGAKRDESAATGTGKARAREQGGKYAAAGDLHFG